LEPIPVCDLKAQFRSLEGELRAALERVLDRSRFILGQEGRSFEEEFADWLGTAHAVGVASGTDAIHLGLRALEVGPGDAVLTAANSASPTACAIAQAGAIPVFADVDPQTGLMDPASLKRQCDAAPGPARIKAIIPVHLYGRCAPMDAILELARERGLFVIEDAAQAHGAEWRGQKAGTLGIIGCFSFYPSKNLGAYGDGGACVTRDPDLAERLRRLRNYGEADRYVSLEIGCNSRLDELQAAVLRTKLPYLQAWNARRVEIAREYERRLRHLPLLLPPSEGPEETAGPTANGSPSEKAVHHLFVIQVAHRDRLRRELAARGVSTLIHYPVPIHLQPAYRSFAPGAGSFPAAEVRAGRILSLPMYPELSPAQIDRVVQALEETLIGEPHPEEISC
jgi:dTDP-4-amino-4,6-dideoxygalactose transaminase